MTVEALHAIDMLKTLGVSCDLLDLRSVSPIDWDMIYESIRQSGRLLTLDTGCATGSISGEIVARATLECWDSLKSAPERLAMPDFPEATSIALTQKYHVRAEQIVEKILEMLGVSVDLSTLSFDRPHPSDVPGDWFVGPF